MNSHYLMEHISRHLHTLVRRYSMTWEFKDKFCARIDFQEDPAENSLISLFSTQNSVSEAPVLLLVNQHAVYASVPADKDIFLLGPVSFSVPINIKKKHTIPQTENTQKSLIPICDFQDFISDILLITNLFRSEPMSMESLLQKNCIQQNLEFQLNRDHTAYTFENHETSKIHNPYDQELREFTSIEKGNLLGLQNSLSEDYPGEIGTLAKTPLRHMKNRGIVVITLASRAAIRGGIPSETAFSLCDSYIQKIEECNDIPTIVHLFHSAEYHYAQIVHDYKESQSCQHETRPNIYTEKCKNYIFSNLHGKISVRNIANELNIHPNYLSEIFHEYEGITITEYIQREKIKLTKNLLIYSKYTYSEIATYLGYSSQSHLGKQFKKHTGMTLCEYRLKYGAKNF